MDQFKLLWLYHMFLSYLRPMMTISNCAMFASMLLILMATVERLLRTFKSENLASIRRLYLLRPFIICLGSLNETVPLYVFFVSCLLSYTSYAHISKSIMLSMKIAPTGLGMKYRRQCWLKTQLIGMAFQWYEREILDSGGCLSLEI